MKKFVMLFIFLFSLPHLIFSQTGWVLQYPEFTNENVSCFYFLPQTNIGWAGGTGGLIIKTTDSGINWQIQNSFTNLEIKTIKFINSQTGWLSANPTWSQQGATFRTTNGGVNWVQVATFGGNVFFIDDNNAIMTAYPADIAKTTNAGATWNFYSTLMSPSEVYFFNAQTGFICGTYGSNNFGPLMKSTNGGINWFQVGGTSSPNKLTSIWFENESSGWAVNDSFVYKTTNGGLNWISNNIRLRGTTFCTMKFFNMNSGYVLTNNYCYRTINGGLSWDTIKYNNNNLAEHISIGFKNIDTGFLSNNRAQLFRTFNSGTNWQYVFGENNDDLMDIKFADQNTGFAVGNNGAILRTTNGGSKWNYSSYGQYFLTSVFFTDNLNGWICGDGILLKTTNGGVNWIQKNNPTNYMKCVYFTSLITGYLQGDYLYKTTNGGENWNLNFTASGTDCIKFINSQTGWISGDNMYNTTNGGMNWIEVPYGGGTSEKSFYFLDINTGWELSQSNLYSELWYTTNSGINWFFYTPYILGMRRTDVIQFVNSQTGFILANNKFYRTTNRGTNWNSYGSVSNSVTFHEMDFVNSQTGWIAGDKSSIKKTINGVYIKKESNNIPTEFRLFQNYPNPFNPTTNIKYQIPKNSFVSLKIFDILGREIETLVNDFQQAGIYETQFPNNSITSNQLSSGIYFYKITARDFTSVKRMLLIK